MTIDPPIDAVEPLRDLDKCGKREYATRTSKMSVLARTIVTRIVDHIDDSADAEAFEFTFDGVSYSIDLRREPRKFEAAMQPYIDAARKTSSVRRRGKRQSAPRDLNAVRE